MFVLLIVNNSSSQEPRIFVRYTSTIAWGIPYHIIPYHIVSYRIISHHSTSYHIISYHIIPYHTASYHIISYHIASYHIISYHIVSCHIISYRNEIHKSPSLIALDAKKLVTSENFGSCEANAISFEISWEGSIKGGERSARRPGSEKSSWRGDTR